jgi:hypothetical protein
MAMKVIVIPGVALVLVAGALILAHQPRKPIVPTIGDPSALQKAYSQWKVQNRDAGGDTQVVLSLAWSKGLSAHHTQAHGEVRLDLAARRVTVDVAELETDNQLDVWLVENRPGPGRSVIIEDGDPLVSVGSLSPTNGTAHLEAALPAEASADFDLDLVVVSMAGSGARAGGLLYGTPDLFQRLYSREQRMARRASDARVSGLLLGVALQSPTTTGPVDDTIPQLVAQGEDLFFNGQFSGNGRTCGTCHPAENNLTIDPEFIATLPNSNRLFVAENVPNPPFPDLVFELNGGRRFENPILMRQHGLIVENQDGFGDLAHRFNTRGVPHVFAQTISIVRPPGGLNPPADRTGWSGDGAPNNGALRDFATGAVTQHFTKTLNRVPNVDFVLPTPDELTAMEAFQRSLGRQAELNLSTLQLRDSNAIDGQILFQDNAVARCNICHFNAGANANPNIFGPSPGNRNFNTGIEFFQVNHPDGSGELRPVDGGFGTNPQGDFTSLVPNQGDPTRPDGGFGNATFNAPSLVEFADTLPGFHNNITNIAAGQGSTPDLPNTVEGAVEFYTRAEFSQAGNQPIVLNAEQIADLGKFLRVINALENRRSASDFARRARVALASGSFNNAAVNRLLAVAVADCTDGIQVLEQVGLHHGAQQRFQQARQKLEGAMSGPTNKRIEKIDQAQEKLDLARADMEVVP